MFVQKQLSEGKFALLSCEELLAFANETLLITDEEEFLKVGGGTGGGARGREGGATVSNDAIMAVSLPGC